MALFRHELPQLEGDLFLAYAGMETDLLFNQGIDLPGFASYPLLESESGTNLLRKSLEDIIKVAAEAGTGVILESPTWVANRDRGVKIGYSPEVLKERNIQSIELMAEVREEKGNLPTVLSANVGPRADAYAPKERMTSEEAEQYHSEQIGNVPLPEAARAVLDSLESAEGNPYVIAEKLEGSHVTDLQHPWRRIRDRAELPGVRIHDLRHTYASNAVSGGMPI